MAKTPRIIPPLSETDLIRFWSHVDKTPGLGPRGDCWLWISGLSPEGYGRFKFNGIEFFAHRISHVLRNGPLSPDKLFVCHECDLPRCVLHTYAGTAQSNMDDKVNRGRASRGATHGDKVRASTPRGDNHYARTQPHRLKRGDEHYSRLQPERLARGDRNGSRAKREKLKRGSEHPNAIVTEIDVLEIRERARRGETVTQMLKDYAIGRSGLEAIVAGRTWKHLILVHPDGSDVPFGGNVSE